MDRWAKPEQVVKFLYTLRTDGERRTDSPGMEPSAD